jgi:dipeptidyl aminopeptidase/acylaminoacyl peptidase
MLTGYLTMPLEWEGDKPSLIVHPHGGPSSRDYQYFDPFVQFFANHGHAVLQVNFRGSNGFGTEFNQAGWRQWGQAMQQDVYDAVEWLEQQDLIDTDRKCVVGASYGGYVALVAAYQKPHEYKCIASIAGISDLYELARLDSLYRSRKAFIGMEVGDPYDANDKQMMQENSPVNHVQEIRAPLLVIHGTEDTRVRINQTRQFYNRATQLKVGIEYLELEDGTHFLDEYNNRLAVFEALDKFLEANL